MLTFADERIAALVEARREVVMARAALRTQLIANGDAEAGKQAAELAQADWIAQHKSGMSVRYRERNRCQGWDGNG